MRRALALLLFTPGLGAQQLGGSPGQPAPAGSRPARDDIAAFLPGRVNDLALDGQNRILFGTEQGAVGRIEPGVKTTLLLPPRTQGPVRGIAETLTGDVAFVESGGDVYVMAAGLGPATRIYADVYMIQDATDLVCDAGGNFLIASATPSSGVRGVNWVSSDGFRWSYYLVRHAPVQLAGDPVSGGLVIVDADAGGRLQLVTPGDLTRPTTLLEGAATPGLTSAADDGDLAFEADGDAWWVAGGKVMFFDRGAGTTEVVSTRGKDVRGAVIAPSRFPGPFDSGWSLYFAEGDGPTILREIANVDPPAPLVATDQGWVPGKGFFTGVNPGFQVFDLAVDNAGHLLIGGTLFQETHYLKRISLPDKTLTAIADDTDGLAGVIEGITVGPDDVIYVVTRFGTIQAIEEGPLSVTTLFNDPLDQIGEAKDLALGVDGRFYVAHRTGWGTGGVVEVDVGLGTATQILAMNESRGLAPRAAGGLFASEWHGTGFEGSVQEIDFLMGGGLTNAQLPGFATMNYTNGGGWGDGDLVVDSFGGIYTVSEDDWSLVRYEPGLDAFVRKGSGYLNHVSGLAIAPSSNGVSSATGWSLYVSQWDFIHELPGSNPPGPTLVSPR